MHVIYNGDSKLLKVYDYDTHALIFQAACRNDTVAHNAWRYPDAGCPPGTFTLGKPEANTTQSDQTSMGPWFIPVYNTPGHYGIGIHGGGTCVFPNSMAPHQGWCPTDNCFRMQNADLIALVKIIPAGGSTFDVHQT